MNKKQKLEKALEAAVSDDLDAYLELVNKVKKKLPFWGGTKKLAAALLKEYLGDISDLKIDSSFLLSKEEMGQIIFEDIKDGKARLFINVGKNQRLNPGELIREIVKRSAIDGKMIGKIDVHPTYSFFEVPENFAELVLHSFDGAKIRGISVVVEPAKKRKK